MKNLKIGTRILLCFGVVIGQMLLITAAVLNLNGKVLANVDTVEKAAVLQNSVNNMLDDFNAAQIQANTICNVTNPDANDAFVYYAEAAALRFDDIFTYIEQNPSFEMFTPTLQEAHQAHHQWGARVENVIEHNAAIQACVEQLSENNEMLQEICRQLLSMNLPAVFAESKDETAEVKWVAVGDIRERASAFRLHIRSFLADMDMDYFEMAVEHLDATVLLAKQYEAQISDAQALELIQSFIAIASQNQEVATVLGQESLMREEAIRQQRSLGERADTAIVASLSGIDRSMFQQVDNTKIAANAARNIVVVLVLVSIVLSALFAWFIVRSITRPIQQVVAAADAVSAGSTHVPVNYEGKSEIGELCDAFRRMADMTTTQIGYTQQLAEGDFSFEVEIRSEQDAIGQAIYSMLDKLNQNFVQVREASFGVNQGSQIVAQIAQELADNTNQQAITVELFSNTIIEMERITNENSDTATQTLEKMRSSHEVTEQCAHSIRQMVEAIEQIDKSSESISSVIKTIEDMAFQTNILALNATVEAARAGEAGLGFAVVAEEVRSLAASSAKAANETAMLIQHSLESVRNGNELAGVVGETVQVISDIAADNLQSVTKINEGCLWQSKMMQDIANEVANISTSVQENSATAQGTAASAQEIASQAVILDSVLGRFKLKNMPSVPELGIGTKDVKPTQCEELGEKPIF